MWSLVCPQTLSRQHHISLPQYKLVRQQQMKGYNLNKRGMLSQCAGFQYLLFRMSTEPWSFWTTKVRWGRSLRIVFKRDQLVSVPERIAWSG